MNKIAIVTSYYPPVKSIASNRMEFFAQYLAKTYQVDVFCSGENNEIITDSLSVYYTSNKTLLTSLVDKQEDSKILHKIKVALRILLSKILKDPLKSWKNNTLKKIINAHEREPYQLIISSFSPIEAHQIAISFCKKYAHIPWIADMRDEMSTNPYLNISTKKKLQEIELEVNEYAKGLISVSLPILNDFKSICPKIKHFEEIRNGFNHEYHRDVNVPANTIFKLGYFGTFYGTRKPTTLLSALLQLNNSNNIDFQFEIYGAHQNFDIPNALKDKVKLLPSLNYLEAIKKMSEMDINVLIHPKSKQKGVFTGKLFDYISAQKPVLALVDTTDVAANLIKEMNAGYCCEFDDIPEIKNQLFTAYNDWQNGHIKYASDENVQQLHRNEQGVKLVKLIEKLIKE